jgi:predicted anti-sigma-YlaC factor YlaD
MDCSDIRSSLSATLDGEDPGLPDSMVRSHLAECGSCSAFSAEASELHRLVRVQPAPSDVDRTQAILAALPSAVAASAPHDHVRSLRIVTLVIALVQLAAAVPLMLGVTDEMHGHYARHIGVFSAALAAGLLAVAWQPDRARGLLPMLGVLVAGLVWSCLDDLMAGQAMPGTAMAHGADVAGFAAVWLIARATSGGAVAERERDHRAVLR